MHSRLIFRPYLVDAITEGVTEQNRSAGGWKCRFNPGGLPEANPWAIKGQRGSTSLLKSRRSDRVLLPRKTS